MCFFPGDLRSAATSIMLGQMHVLRKETCLWLEKKQKIGLVLANVNS